MNRHVIWEIARQELTVSIRNKWTAIFAAVFCLLVVAVSYAGTITEGFTGMESFTRTSASILNLVLYIIPLLALTMGTLSFTGDRGAAELLYAQPVSRGEILVGKLAGLFSSSCVSTLAGFTVAGLVILWKNGAEGLGRYLALVALSLMLALVFLSLAGLVATMTQRKARAFGYALFLWFFFVLFYDLLVLGGTLLLSGRASKLLVFFSLFGNPVDMVRVACLITLENETIFGAAGAVLLRFLGGPTLSLLILIGALAAWVVAPVGIAYRFLLRQDI